MSTTRKPLVISALLLLVCAGCNRGGSGMLPPELVGHWTTVSAAYHGRFLELSPTYVIIGAGEQGSPDVQTVDRVDALPADGGTLYTIHATTREGLHNQIVLQFNPREGGEIRIKNQTEVVWKRVEGQAPSSSLSILEVGHSG